MAKLTVDDIGRKNFPGEEHSVSIENQELESFINSISYRNKLMLNLMIMWLLRFN